MAAAVTRSHLPSVFSTEDINLFQPNKLAKLLHSGHAHVIVLMGPSGVGKSTLMNLLGSKLQCKGISVDDLVESGTCEEEAAASYIKSHYGKLSSYNRQCELIIDSNQSPTSFSEELGPLDLGKGICFICLYRPLDNLVSGFVARACKGKEPEHPVPVGGLGFCLQSFSHFFSLEKEASSKSQAPLNAEIMQSVEAIVSQSLERHENKGMKRGKDAHYLKSEWDKLHAAYKSGNIHPTAHPGAFVFDVSQANLQGKKTSIDDLKGDLKELFDLL